jgi:hypothetical protein
MAINGTFKYTSGGSYRSLATITLGKENATDGNDAGYISLNTRPNGGSVTTRVTVSSAGVVNVAGLTASQPVFTDASKNLVSVSPVPYADLPIRRLSAQYTLVGNVGTGQDDLMTYTLPGGTVSADGASIEITAAGYVASNGNSKSLRFVWGANTFTLLLTATDSGFKWRA